MSTTPPISALGLPASGTTRSPKPTMGKDDFLGLLVAQLRHQDPSGSNSDPSQFVTQMTQFTLLEQVSNMAKANEELVQTTHRDAALALVGRTVKWADGEGVVEKVTVTKGEPTLHVGGQAVDPASLTEVR